MRVDIFTLIESDPINPNRLSNLRQNDSMAAASSSSTSKLDALLTSHNAPRMLSVTDVCSSTTPTGTGDRPGGVTYDVPTYDTPAAVGEHFKTDVKIFTPDGVQIPNADVNSEPDNSGESDLGGHPCGYDDGPVC